MDFTFRESSHESRFMLPSIYITFTESSHESMFMLPSMDITFRESSQENMFMLPSMDITFRKSSHASIQMHYVQYVINDHHDEGFSSWTEYSVVCPERTWPSMYQITAYLGVSPWTWCFGVSQGATCYRGMYRENTITGHYKGGMFRSKSHVQGYDNTIIGQQACSGTHSGKLCSDVGPSRTSYSRFFPVTKSNQIKWNQILFKYIQAFVQKQRLQGPFKYNMLRVPTKDIMFIVTPTNNIFGWPSRDSMFKGFILGWHVQGSFRDIMFRVPYRDWIFVCPSRGNYEYSMNHFDLIKSYYYPYLHTFRQLEGEVHWWELLERV